MNTAKAVREAREERGHSQRDLADILGISQQAIGRWEKSGSVPRRYWDQLSDLYGIAFDNKTDKQLKKDNSVEEKYLIQLIREKDRPDMLRDFIKQMLEVE